MNNEKSKGKLRVLVVTSYMMDGVNYQSYCIYKRKEFKEEIKLIKTYFKQGKELDVPLEHDFDATFVDYRDVMDDTAVRIITKHEAKLFIKSLGYEFGPLSLAAITEAIEQQNMKDQEQVPVEIDSLQEVGDE